MAGPEVAGAVVGAVARPVFDPACDFVCSKIKNAFNLPSNLVNLEWEMERLRVLREEVKEKKEAAEKEGEKIRATVVTWLEDVETLERRFDPIEEQMKDINYKKPSACFLNCCTRYKESTDVDEILKETKRLLEAGIGPDNVVSPTIGPRTDEYLDVPSIQSQTIASKALAETRRLLNDGEVQRIGIWGMGGIGKSALVKTLYNELNKSTSTHPFGIVIYAIVSKDLTVSNDLVMKEVQTQIAKRLDLELQADNVVEAAEAARKLSRRLRNEAKFLLILDDVWKKIDLATLGVPLYHNGCKIIFTSRDLQVCRVMEFDADVRMDRLTDEDALQLFCEKAKVSNDEIRPFAEKIAKKCCGLPLAIITVGAAMRSKPVDQWKDALQELERPVGNIGRIEKAFYNPLKLSYDSLQDENTKSSFLYCSLFPKAFPIKISELEQYLLAEGLIDRQHSIKRLINDLKDSCLLEDGADEGTVKMHEVIREVAIWIGSSSEDGNKSLVLSGSELREITVEDFSKSGCLKRVSFMSNKITRLPECKIQQCSKASTLLLQHNPSLEEVPEIFLQGFVALKVLNLSETNIQSLPVSIMQLGDLRALLLRNCRVLGKLPSLEKLGRLEMLDLSGTQIRELSQEMRNLSNLRRLDLSHTRKLETIQVGIISGLSRLEFLDMTDSASQLLVKREEDEGEKTFEELGRLDRLLFSSIRLKMIPKDLSWIKKLEGFQISIGPTVGLTTTNGKRVIVGLVDFSQESIGHLWGIAESLVLDDCWGLDEMLEDLVNKSVTCFNGLKSLAIAGFNSFDKTVRVIGDLAAQYDLLPNLEELILSRLNVLESISELVGYLGLRFPKLKLIKVSDCSDMKYLLSCGDDCIQTLPKLEVIKVSNCSELDVLFKSDSRQNMAPHTVVPKLRTLELEKLPELRSLCRHKETWPCLEQVKVWQCEQLRRLPLSIQNAVTIKEIVGESEWWDALEWDRDETKSSLQPYFRPTLSQF